MLSCLCLWYHPTLCCGALSPVRPRCTWRMPDQGAGCCGLMCTSECSAKGAGVAQPGAAGRHRLPGACTGAGEHPEHHGSWASVFDDSLYSICTASTAAQPASQHRLVAFIQAFLCTTGARTNNAWMLVKGIRGGAGSLLLHQLLPRGLGIPTRAQCAACSAWWSSTAHLSRSSCMSSGSYTIFLGSRQSAFLVVPLARSTTSR